jgi:FAD/FMN-containing dehydrogenase
MIRTGDLNHILDINTTSRFVMVEPNVSMDQLLKETLKHKLMPPVVPAFPGTTVSHKVAYLQVRR